MKKPERIPFHQSEPTWAETIAVCCVLATVCIGIAGGVAYLIMLVLG